MRGSATDAHEIKSMMYEHVDGQPGNWKVYQEYHEKLRRYDG